MEQTRVTDIIVEEGEMGVGVGQVMRRQDDRLSLNRQDVYREGERGRGRRKVRWVDEAHGKNYRRRFCPFKF